jgi:hypothetical protein
MKEQRRGERQSGLVSARRPSWDEERTEFSFGLNVRGDDARGGGCMHCAWSGHRGRSTALMRGGGSGRAAVTYARRQRPGTV